MVYVYILQSIHQPEHVYVGYTDNLKLRFYEHNSGKARYTNMYKPWKIKSYFAFDTKEKAEKFENYLKTHAGRDFQKKYL
jgi:predicted GIY-YIG superfamily endonuclease